MKQKSNQQGCQVSEGRSLLKRVATWQDVHRYCTDLARSMSLSNNEQFEITGVSVWLDDEVRQDPDDCKEETEQLLLGSSDHSNGEGNEGSSGSREVPGSCSSLPSTCSDLPNKKKEGQKPSFNEMSCNKVDNGSDVEIKEVRQGQGFKFVPLTYASKNGLCRKHGIGQISLDCNEVSDKCEEMGKPDLVKKIKGDGNCFFRAISFAVSGTEENHVQLRMATVNHLLKNGDKFNGFLRQGFVNVEEYVIRQRMFDSGVWSTEVEIMAMAQNVGYRHIYF
ncbi:uncharacterized protein LOC119723495 [Patiria miniata]|uniref:OTU domain-containing protein n=1 Tax=Patiria miniata TaxID=46514 RepID=A0A913ZE92_PATMI|nr:uncharacterized protein LOC119723495 [Patiria miniata]